MIVKDIKTDFYSVIKGKRVLVVVNYDIDAICACKILQSLFKTDYILYTLVPVDVTSDLKLSIEKNRLDEKFIIFINCGGTVDLIEELAPEENITIFVLDSHRPLDVCNIYNPDQIRLLSTPEQGVPDFNDIFSDGEDDERSENEEEEEDDDEYEREEGDSENFDTQESKRRRLTEEAVSKRRNRKKWEARRDNLLFQYTKFSYYGKSSALIMFELAWKLSKDSFDLLWCGIVGLTEQLLMRKIADTEYLTECGDIQNHIARLCHRSSQTGEEERNVVKIRFEKDLRLSLLRHWTVKSSLMYSTFTATRLKLWTYQGENRLHQMLAEIGIPLAQCNQKFTSMDLIFRQEFQESLEKKRLKYSLHGIDVLSFLMQHGFRAKYAAMDFVYGLLALLQSFNDERPKTDCFLECLEALCRTKKDRIDQGIDLAKKILISVFKQSQSALEMKQIQCAGSFLYLIVQEGNADPMLCSHPYGILLLADFALRAFLSTTKIQKYKLLPLVLSTPCIKESTYGTPGEALCHITGVAPIPQDNNANFFGRAFKKVSDTLSLPIIDTYFDSSVITINIKDRSRFLDTLAVLLNED